MSSYIRPPSTSLRTTSTRRSWLSLRRPKPARPTSAVTKPQPKNQQPANLPNNNNQAIPFPDAFTSETPKTTANPINPSQPAPPLDALDSSLVTTYGVLLFGGPISVNVKKGLVVLDGWIELRGKQGVQSLPDLFHENGNAGRGCGSQNKRVKVREERKEKTTDKKFVLASWRGGANN